MKSFENQLKNYQQVQKQKQMMGKLMELKTFIVHVESLLKYMNSLLFKRTYYDNYHNSNYIFDKMKNLKEQVEKILVEANRLNVPEYILNNLNECIASIANITDKFSDGEKIGYENYALSARFYFKRFSLFLSGFVDTIEQQLKLGSVDKAEQLLCSHATNPSPAKVSPSTQKNNLQISSQDHASLMPQADLQMPQQQPTSSLAPQADLQIPTQNLSSPLAPQADLLIPTHHPCFSLAPDANLLIELPIEIRTEIGQYLSAKDLLRLSSALRLSKSYADFSNEMQDLIYWHDKIIAIGCNGDLLKKVINMQLNGRPVITDYRNLYRSLSALKKVFDMPNTAWELLCLSGEPAAILYAIQMEHLTDKTQNSETLNALHLVALSGNKQGMDLVVNQLKIDPNRKTDCRCNALFTAALGGHVSAMEHAAKALKINPNQLFMLDWLTPRITLLEYASLSGNVKAMKYAIELGSPINAFWTSVVFKQTAYHMAAENGNVKAMDYLHELGVSGVNRINKNGYTIFLSAASKGHADAMEKAIALGNKVDSVDVNGHNALIIGAIVGHVDVMRKAVELGLDPNIIHNNPLLNVASFAVASGKLQAVKYTIEELRIAPPINILPLAAGFDKANPAVIIYLRQLGFKPKVQGLDAFEFARKRKNDSEVILNALRCPLPPSTTPEGPITRLPLTMCSKIFSFMPVTSQLKCREVSTHFQKIVGSQISIDNPYHVFAILSTPLPMKELHAFIRYYTTTRLSHQLKNQHATDPTKLSSIEMLCYALTTDDIKTIKPELLHNAILDIEQEKQDANSIHCLTSLKLTLEVLRCNSLDLLSLLDNPKLDTHHFSPYINLQGCVLLHTKFELPCSSSQPKYPWLAKANFSGAFLQDIAFINLDLSSTCFSNAFLLRATFVDTLFSQETRFNCAYLKEAVLDKSASFFAAMIDNNSGFTQARIQNIKPEDLVKYTDQMAKFPADFQQSVFAQLVQQLNSQFIEKIINIIESDECSGSALLNLIKAYEKVKDHSIFNIPCARYAKQCLEKVINIVKPVLIEENFVQSINLLKEYFAAGKLSEYQRLLAEILTHLADLNELLLAVVIHSLNVSPVNLPHFNTLDAVSHSQPLVKPLEQHLFDMAKSVLLENIDTISNMNDLVNHPFYESFAVILSSLCAGHDLSKEDKPKMAKLFVLVAKNLHLNGKSEQAQDMLAAAMKYSIFTCTTLSERELHSIFSTGVARAESQRILQAALESFTHPDQPANRCRIS